MPVAAWPYARWSLGFVSDSCGASRKFRLLAVTDDYIRECLCLVADTSLSGARVTRELSALIRIYGKPGCIVSEKHCRQAICKANMPRGGRSSPAGRS
mgnify:CR=1 FL=1